MKILLISLYLIWLFFVGEWIYGIVKDKRKKQSFATSKHTFIGLIGLNFTALCINIVTIII